MTSITFQVLQWSLAMKTNEFYFLVMACSAFVLFGLALAANYIQYRRWLKQSGEHR
jgi:hypothetical protein